MVGNSVSSAKFILIFGDLLDLQWWNFWMFWIIFGVIQFCNLHDHIWCYCCYWLSHVWRQDSITDNFESAKRFICFKSCTVDHGKCCLFALLISKDTFEFLHL
jgi:hypothetical protein